MPFHLEQSKTFLWQPQGTLPNLASLCLTSSYKLFFLTFIKFQPHLSFSRIQVPSCFSLPTCTNALPQLLMVAPLNSSYQLKCQSLSGLYQKDQNWFPY